MKRTDAMLAARTAYFRSGGSTIRAKLAYREAGGGSLRGACLTITDNVVERWYQSMMIAQALGVSPSAVDDDIQAAFDRAQPTCEQLQQIIKDLVR